MIEKILEKKHKHIIGCLLFVIFILVLSVCSLKLKLDNTIENPKLNDCYICGKKVEVSQVNDSYHIDCDTYKGGCGLSTGYYRSKKELVEDWNGIGN